MGWTKKGKSETKSAPLALATESETALLGCLLADCELMTEVLDKHRIEHNNFSSDFRETVFRGMQRKWSRSEKWDTATITDELMGRFPNETRDIQLALMEMTTIGLPNLKFVGLYAKLVRRAHLARQIVVGVEKIARDMDPMVNIDRVRNALALIVSDAEELKGLDSADA